MTHNPNNTAEPTAGQARPPKPSALRVIPEAIPSRLKALPQWVVWRYLWQKGKWDKPLLQSHSGNLASHSSPNTWSDIEAAINAYLFDGANLDGIGFVFKKENGLFGIDLDDCRDPITGAIEPWAQEIIDLFNTYTEISTSETGVHLIGEGTLPGLGVKTATIELYDNTRYFCTTGNVLPGTPGTIEPVPQELITELYQRLRAQQARAKQKASTPSTNGANPSPHADDDDILEKARAATNGDHFISLWDGEISSYPSHSEADLALCRLLAFFTQDAAQIDRLFRQSGLMRDKWEHHPSYSDTTITLAIESARDHWRGVSAAPSNGQPQDEGAGDERNASSISDEQAPITEDYGPPIHLTDRGNALRLVKRYGEGLHYIYRWKKWLVWDGSRWLVDEGHRVESLAKRVITQLYTEAKAIIDRLSQHLDDTGDIGEDARKIRAQQISMATTTLKWALKSESAERLSGMLRQARSERGLAITPDQLDADPWLLNVGNGIIDLRTGTLHPHRREDLCMKRLDIAYDPHATCPHWLTFLWRIMGGPKPDDEGLETALQERHERAERLVKFLQRAVGYSLTGVIREQVLFFMYGGGDNGKSTFSETIAALLGEYYQKAPKELLMQKDRRDMGGPSPEIARLCGVRLVIASEVGEHHRLNEAQVKDLTGDDTLTARGLYEAFFQFRPSHKLWMYGNHKPAVQGTDDAIWKRPKLIPFTEKIPPTEQISDLREKSLIPELPGILAWAVQGCLAWQKDGLQVPDEVNAATAAYRREMDAIAAFFDEHCVIGKDYTSKGAELYARYTQWGESGRESVLPRRKFYDQLRDRGCISFMARSNVFCWRGIGLKKVDTSASDE